MSNMENRFRTAAFGGFQKQDVLNYITAASKQSQARLAELTQARQERDELARRCEKAESEQARSAEECGRLSEELLRRTEAQERAERELAGLKAEHERTLERVAEMEQSAQSYRLLKERTAAIELDAHRVAQETVDKANAEARALRLDAERLHGEAQAQAEQVRSEAQASAEKTRGEVERWLQRVQSGYQRLYSGVSATLARLSGELERGQKALGEMPSEFRKHGEALNELLERPAGLDLEPLPLDGEDAAPDNGAEGPQEQESLGELRALDGGPAPDGTGEPAPEEKGAAGNV